MPPLTRNQIDLAEHRITTEQARVLAAVTYGLTKKEAAEKAGLHKRDVQEWINRGKKGDEDFTPFWDLYRIAKQHATVGRVQEIRETARGRPTKALRIRRKRIEVAVDDETGEVLGPVDESTGEPLGTPASSLPWLEEAFEKVDGSTGTRQVPDGWHWEYRMVEVERILEEQETRPDWRGLMAVHLLLEDEEAKAERGEESFLSLDSEEVKQLDNSSLLDKLQSLSGEDR